MTAVGAALLALAVPLVPDASASVYWANFSTGTIGRANLQGRGLNQGFIKGAQNPVGVAVDEAHVYWANSSLATIGRANLDGSGVSQSFITGATSPQGVSVDGAHLYWANFSTGTIGRANLDGTGINQSFITGASQPNGVAVDGAHVYWTNVMTNTIGRANLDGSSVDQSFIGALRPTWVAVDSTNVYWTNSNTNALGRAGLDGTGVDQSFITGASGPNGVAVGGGNVYWANSPTSLSGTIGRANLDGTGANQSFITDAGAPQGVAVSPLETTLTAGPSGTVGSGAATFVFRGSEPSGFQCRLDGGGWSSCGSPASVDGLASGVHTFEVRALDDLGDVEVTPASRVWTVGISSGAIPPIPPIGASTSTLAFGAATLVKVGLAAGRIPGGGPLSVRIANSNGFVVTGSLSGETAGPVAARKRRVKLKANAFSIGAHASKVVKLKLPKALRQLLSRKRKLSLNVTAKLKDPAGHTRTVTQRVTPKLK